MRVVSLNVTGMGRNEEMLREIKDQNADIICLHGVYESYQHLFIVGMFQREYVIYEAGLPNTDAFLLKLVSFLCSIGLASLYHYAIPLLGITLVVFVYSFSSSVRVGVRMLGRDYGGTMILVLRNTGISSSLFKEVVSDTSLSIICVYVNDDSTGKTMNLYSSISRENQELFKTWITSVSENVAFPILVCSTFEYDAIHIRTERYARAIHDTSRPTWKRGGKEEVRNIIFSTQGLLPNVSVLSEEIWDGEYSGLDSHVV